METAIAALVKWLADHLALLTLGLMGALLGVILSNEKWTARIAGFVAGMILCIALSDWTAEVLAGGRHAEIFGFFWGAIGKSTAEGLISKIRAKFLKKVDEVNLP